MAALLRRTRPPSALTPLLLLLVVVVVVASRHVGEHAEHRVTDLVGLQNQSKNRAAVSTATQTISLIISELLKEACYTINKYRLFQKEFTALRFCEEA